MLNLLPPLTNQAQSHAEPEGFLDSTEIHTIGAIVDAEVFDEMLQTTSEETWLFGDNNDTEFIDNEDKAIESQETLLHELNGGNLICVKSHFRIDDHYRNQIWSTSFAMRGDHGAAYTAQFDGGGAENQLAFKHVYCDDSIGEYIPRATLIGFDPGGSSSQAGFDLKAVFLLAPELIAGDPKRDYFSRVLLRQDWFLFLNHELRATRIVLNSQFVFSVLQNLEHPLHPLQFYIWVSNIDSLFARDQSVKGALANSLYRKGPVILSVELLKEIIDSGCRVTEELLCILIGSWGRLGLAKYCNEIFVQISFLGLRHSTRLYNAVIDALVQSNSLDAAYLKFQQMKADSCTPDRFTYNILIHGVCRMGVVDKAIRLVKQMEGLGYASNVFPYTILIDGFCNAKRVDEAFKVIETMKARNVRTNETTIRSLVHGVFRCVTPGEAFELIIGFIERTPTMGRLACDALLCCLSNNRMPREAGTLLNTYEKLVAFPFMLQVFAKYPKSKASANILFRNALSHKCWQPTAFFQSKPFDPGISLPANMLIDSTLGVAFVPTVTTDFFLQPILEFTSYVAHKETDLFLGTAIVDSSAKGFFVFVAMWPWGLLGSDYAGFDLGRKIEEPSLWCIVDVEVNFDEPCSLLFPNIADLIDADDPYIFRLLVMDVGSVTSAIRSAFSLHETLEADQFYSQRALSSSLFLPQPCGQGCLEGDGNVMGLDPAQTTAKDPIGTVTSTLY